MKDAAVRLESVEKRFGNQVAVAGVDLTIDSGEFFSLLGPSGCGKTTTLRMIAGFEQPTSGRVLLMGEDVTGVPPHRRATNLVFQNYALFPHLTVFENVAFGLRVKRVARDLIPGRVERALSLVQLSGLERRKPGQLSGGQQQRVALARALINEPHVLLLDEPLGALDQKLRREMQFELKRLQREIGITFVYVTHDQEEALTMSDRIAVMNKGEVLQVDPPTALYETPATRFVAEFIGTSNFVDGVVVASGSGEVGVAVEGLGNVPAMSAGALRVGDPVTLVIRPERLLLDHEGRNGFRGVVLQSVFVGNDTLYVVAMDGGRQLTIRRQNDEHAGDRFREGDAVAVAVRRAWAIRDHSKLGD